MASVAPPPPPAAVVQLLTALHAPNTPRETRVAASRQLEAFENRAGAWRDALQLFAEATTSLTLALAPGAPPATTSAAHMVRHFALHAALHECQARWAPGPGSLSYEEKLELRGAALTVLERFARLPPRSSRSTPN